MNTTNFCSTVSNAFASLDEGFRDHIDKYKKKWLNWKEFSFEKQYEELVADPLRVLNRPAILIIDALDECDNVIKLIEVLRGKQSSVPLLRTLITSRPVIEIQELVMNIDGIRTESFKQLEGDNQDVEKYIQFQLKNQASEIRDRVIRRADGHFLWARLACDALLKDVPYINRTLQALEGPSEGPAKLDSIYRVALGQAMPDIKSSQKYIRIALQMLLAMRTPLSLAELKEISPWSNKGIVEHTIHRLRSLLSFQGPNDPIRLLHTTFREFLTSRERAGEYFIQLELGHFTLARGSLKILGHYSRTASSVINSFDEDSRR